MGFPERTQLRAGRRARKGRGNFPSWKLLATRGSAFPPCARSPRRAGVATGHAKGAARDNEEVIQMGKDLLNEFVNRGWLDRSVTEGFDPYYEPQWFGDSDWRDDDAWDASREVGAGCGDVLAGAWL